MDIRYICVLIYASDIHAISQNSKTFDLTSEQDKMCCMFEVQFYGKGVIAFTVLISKLTYCYLLV